MSPSSSVAIIEGNDDLLIEILLLLPAKSLVRLKLVSKRWRLLISAPSFCRLHSGNRHRETHQALFIGGSHISEYLVYNLTAHRFLSYSFPLEFSNVRILQSCNGLLLLRCGEGEEADSHSYHVFNPTTMQQRDLSPLPNRNVVGRFYLMFDPSLSPHYKVVCFVYAKKCTLTLIYVYDSEMHGWKVGGERNESAINFRNGIYFNGGIYFDRFDSSSSSRFNPDDHNVSKTIPNPHRHCSTRMSNVNYVMESNGVLLSLTLSIMEGICQLNVWELKENEDRWSKQYWANLQPILAACGVRTCYVRLLCMIRGEKEQDSLLLLSLLHGNKIVIYRFCDDSFEVVVDYTSLNKNLQFQDGHHIIHSLAHV